jgi:RND family efflux transporter MFP subunit
LRKLIRFIYNGLLPLALIAGSFYGSYILLRTPPRAKKVQPAAVAPVVGVTHIVSQDADVFIEAFGTVIPAKEVTLRTEVGGRIHEINERLVPGGLVSAGKTLVRVDPSDYEIAVRRAEANLVEANSDYDIEQGQQIIAKRGWDLLRDELSDEAANRDLALRKPQLEQARAKRDSAQAELEQAKLELERTTVVAPFDALVLEESVEKGQLVQPQNEMAVLVGAEEFWVLALAPLDQMDRIRFPDGTGLSGSAVDVFLSVGENNVLCKSGEITRFVGDLDPDGRMAKVLISIEDPLGLQNGKDSGSSATGRLLLGSYVRLAIEAGSFSNVCSIPRTALRENSRVWLLTPEETLKIQEVEVLWRREEDVLVANSFQEGDQLITTRLSRVMPGMKLEAAERPSSTAERVEEPAAAKSDNPPSPGERKG